MTSREEIERLLNQTGRTLEGLPTEYPNDRCRAVGRVHGLTPAVAGKSILHQTSVIDLLVGALRDALEESEKQKTLAEMNRILLEEAGKLMPEWINVKERLPEKYQAVIVHVCHTYSPNDGWSVVESDIWCGDGWDANADSAMHKVTHWMPLPEPPKEEA